MAHPYPSQAPRSRPLLFAQIVFRRWRLLVCIPLAVGLVAAVLSLLVNSRYTSTVAFTPVGRRTPQLPAALAGLASQLVPGFGSELTQVPGYYVQVLQSRAVMGDVLLRRFRDPAGGPADTMRLMDMLVPRAKSDELRMDAALRRLRKRVAISADNQTSVLRVSVELLDRRLAADVANAFVERLNAFNLDAARGQARQRREFVEERRDEVQQDLRDAEERLRAFLQANRSYQNSPDLTFEHQRLERQLMLRQELFLTLSRAYENMRVEEANTVAAITVIDPAVPPASRSYPSRRAAVMMALVLGFSLAAVLAALLEYLETVRAQDAVTWRELSEVWQVFLRELRHPLRRVERASGNGLA